MKKYVAQATVLGLRPGDTFDSDDQFYARLAKSGVIKEVPTDDVRKDDVQQKRAPSDDLTSRARRAFGESVAGGAESESPVLE